MLNKVFLIGRLTRDPELRFMPNGEAVCNFGLATSEKWKNKNGEPTEKTEFHNITLYRRMAEVAGQYLKKGSQVYIEGRIQSRKYTDKNGVERTAYEIIGSEMKMLGGGNDSGQQNAQHTPPAPPSRQAPAEHAQPVDDIDGIPF